MKLLLISLLLTAAPRGGPRAPVDAELAFYLPRLDDAAQMVPFLDLAGEKAGLLRREAWRNDVHPLLRLDVTRRESLEESGLDPLGAGTLSFKGELSFSCVSLADPKKYEAACAERLKTLGSPWRKELGGVAVVGAKDSLGRVLSGYVLKGKESCAITSGGHSVEKELLELGKLLGKSPGGPMWKLAQAQPGQAVLVSPSGVAGLKSNGLALTMELKSARYPVARLAGGGSSPYADGKFEGLLWARLRAEPSQAPLMLAQVNGLLSQACRSCDRAALAATADGLAPVLSGNALLMVPQVKVKASLRTFAGRFFALQLAMLAETTDPKAARAALELLAGAKGARPLENGEGYSLLMPEGEVKVGVRGSHLYLANDGAVLEATLKAVPEAAGKQAHGLELGVDPERLARGLSQVPLSDVLAVPELAGVLAASAEGGPLLLASEKLSGYADSDGATAVRGQLVWTLKKPPPPAPPAPPAR